MSISAFTGKGALFGGVGALVDLFLQKQERKVVQTAEVKKATATPAPVASTDQRTAQEKMAAEQEAQQVSGEKSSRKAAAFLKSRNAQGFGANPNVAKPFLLSL